LELNFLSAFDLTSSRALQVFTHSSSEDKAMKLWHFFATIAVLVSCATTQTVMSSYKAGKPIQTWYKNNATFPEIDNASTSCQVYAAQQVPQNMQVRQSPSYTTPVNTYCNRIGTQTLCNSYGGDTIGGGVYSVDANGILRNKVFLQCMASTGHQYVNISPCPAGVQLKTNGRLPNLSGKTCYMPATETTFAIYEY
jgi:hypothetical protein